MVTVEEAKAYLRLDADLTEDDELLAGLIQAAADFLEQTTGKVYSDDRQLYVLAVKMLTAHWYENRSIYSTKTNVNDLPVSLQAMINHISMAAAYEPLADNSTIQKNGTVGTAGAGGEPP